MKLGTLDFAALHQEIVDELPGIARDVEGEARSSGCVFRRERMGPWRQLMGTRCDVRDPILIAREVEAVVARGNGTPFGRCVIPQTVAIGIFHGIPGTAQETS